MKRIPKERLDDARMEFLATAWREAERNRAEYVTVARAENDPSLSPDQRLELFKHLQAWPRIVLGLYNAELAAAQRDRKKKDLPKHGREEPSEIALRVVGKALGLSAERIRQLCKEGRRHLRQGMPAKIKVEIRAAEFLRYLAAPR